MSRGQALRRRPGPWHLLGRLCLSLLVAMPMMLGLAMGVLVWRLSQGEIESSFLARRIEATVNRPDGEARLEIRRAAIAWQGWQGDGAPLDIRLSGVVLRDRAGQQRGTLPDANVTLALGPLLRGVLAPATIELREPSFTLLRDAEGALSLDIGGSAEAPAGAAAEAPDETEEMLADLMGPPEERATHTSLRRIRVTGGQVTVRDARLGRDWALKDPQMELRRLARGGVEGDGEATLRVGEVDIPVHLLGRIEGAPLRFSLRLDLPVLRPGDVADLLPPLGALAMLDAPVAIQALGEFDAAGRPTGYGLTLQAEQGGDLRLAAGSRLPFTRLAARLIGDRDRVVLEEAVLELAGTEGMALNADGDLQRTPEGWQGRLRAAVERLDLKDLPHLWPEGLAPEAREAARLALPHGTLGAATLRLGLAADADFSAWRPLDGSLDASLAEVRLVTPEGAALDMDHAELQLRAGPGGFAVDALELALAPPLAPPLGEAREGTRISLRGSLDPGARGWAGRLHARVERLELAEIWRLWPESLAPESRDAARAILPSGMLETATLGLDLASDADFTGWRTPGGDLAFRLTGARLVTPEGVGIELEEAEGKGTASPTRINLEALKLRLGAPDRPTSAVAATGEASREEGRWRGALDVTLDRLAFADLPALWPRELAPGARSWIIENIPAGEVSQGRWSFRGESPGGLAEAELTGLSGEAELRQGVVHWLRPMPPVRQVAGLARFGLQEITVQVTGGKLDNLAGQPGGLELRESTLRFLLPPGGLPSTEMAIAVTGPAAETVALLRHPRLKLFERRPFPVQVAAGSQQGRVQIAFPLVADLHMDMVRLTAEARVSNAKLTRLIFDRDLEEVNFDLTADADQMRLSGTGVLNAIPLRIVSELDFRAGPSGQVVERSQVTGRADAQRIAELGFDTGGLLTGPVALEVRSERRRNGQQTVNLRGDLRDAVLSFPPLGWTKPPGSPGRAEAVLRLQGEQVTSIEAIRIEALELALRARAVARGGRIERIELQETGFGGSRMVGDARAPAQRGGPWAITLRGPVLDLRSLFGPAGHVAGGAARDREPAPPPPETTQPPLSVDLRFDQVLLGPAREVFAVQARGRLDQAGVLREANLRARTSRQSGAFELTMTPRGEARVLRGSAEDGGALLRAMGLIETIQGGRLQLTAEYPESRPGTPLTGTAELETFTVRNAPALGKLLQAMTLWGLVEAVQGGSGLIFNRAVVPFSLSPTELRLNDARAFSASLGLTARGRVMRERVILDLDGTIVPAYFFNTLLGNLPLVGRLFSPEEGGGVFAATFRAQGPPDDAEVTVNPLAMVTPGFLRGMFGLTEPARPGR
jgi:hypothetical protein